MDIKTTPLSIKKALKKFGQDFHEARKRLESLLQLSAERAAISRVTLSKIKYSKKRTLAVDIAYAIYLSFIKGKSPTDDSS